MLQASIAGTVGQDAELKDAGGSQLLVVSVAVNGYDRKAKEKTTQWVRVQVWGKRGDQLASLLTKGSRVACSGALEVNTYDARDGTTKVSLQLTVQDITLLGGGSQGGSGSGGGNRSGGQPAPARSASGGDDDIPF